MKRLFNFDSLVGIIGLVTTFIIFIIQSPNASSKDYLLIFSPLAIATLIVITRISYNCFRDKFSGLLAAIKYFNQIDSLRASALMYVRVENDCGDTNYERNYKYRQVRNGARNRVTLEDGICSSVPLNCIPPAVQIKDSNLNSVRVSGQKTEEKVVRINGKKHFCYKWKYRVDPPLSKMGDFVDFNYFFSIPNLEKDAFTDEGSIFGYYVTAPYVDVECVLFSPASYFIEVIEKFIEEPDSRRIEVPEDSQPQLSISNNILTWKPRFRYNAKYICRYRFRLS